MLTIKDLTFRYNPEKSYLWVPLSHTFREGDIVLIKGGNGSGKTTLLYTICGIIPRVISGEMQGEIVYNGKMVSGLPLNEIAPQINILFQEPDKQIFMPVVEEEIVFGPENLALDPHEIKMRLEKLLLRFNLTNLRKRATASLSFGQKKLVVLASILAISPAIILLDEFSAGLEEGMIVLLSNYLKELHSEGKTIILADHHPFFEDLAGTIIDLDQVRIAEDVCNK